MDCYQWLKAMQLSAAQGPLYRQIAEAIAAGIRADRIGPGAKLPPERELADRLGVSRTTIINAYHDLAQRNLVISRVGSGTFVAEGEPGPAAAAPATLAWTSLLVPPLSAQLSDSLRSLITPPSPDTITLAVGMPDPLLYPTEDFLALWNRKQPDPAALGYVATEGYEPLRRSLASLQASRGFAADPHSILVLSGSQQGIYLVAKALLEPQDCVIVEAPAYLGAIQVFQAAGVRILSVPRTSPFSFDVLENYLIRYRPKLFYINPTFQNPHGGVMTEEERRELVRMAARYRLVVLEDDPYSELYYDRQPPPSLKAYTDYEGILYMSTFSKILLPGLRVGWLSGPPQLIYRLAIEKQYVDLHTNNLTQWLLNQFLEEDRLPDYLTKLRVSYKTRRDALVAGLRRHCRNALDFTVPGGGFYLWCKIRPSVYTPHLFQEIARQAVAVTPGEAFYANGFGADEMRLCFASHDVPVLQEGVRRLGQGLFAPGRQGGCAPAVPQAGYPLV